MNQLNIFFAYSREDSDLRNRLDKHLASLKRQEYIKTWYDGKIESGKEWEGEIFSALESADIILLLISADFISSDYCYNVELDKAIKRHNNGEAVVIPIIIKHCDWTDTPFSKIQALPKDAIPIMDRRWDTEDLAMKDVAIGIRAIVTRKFKEREERINSYFKEVTMLKEEKAKLENELFFVKKILKEVEGRINSNPQEELLRKMDAQKAIIQQLEIKNYELEKALINQTSESKKTIKSIETKRAQIINVGYTYSTINETDSGEWINDEVKSKAGEEEWKKHGFFPKVNMNGEIVGSFVHPNGGNLIYVLLIDNRFYVPIGADGVKLL